MCQDANCGAFTVCSENSINGTCSTAVECLADEDCALGQYCDIEHKLCLCNDTITDDACSGMSDDDFTFFCGPFGRHCVSLCTPPIAEAYDYSSGELCPEDFTCIPIEIPIDIVVQLIVVGLGVVDPAEVPTVFDDLPDAINDFVNNGVPLPQAFAFFSAPFLTDELLFKNKNFGPNFEIDFGAPGEDTSAALQFVEDLIN